MIDCSKWYISEDFTTTNIVYIKDGENPYLIVIDKDTFIVSVYEVESMEYYQDMFKKIREYEMTSSYMNRVIMELFGDWQ